MPCRGDGNGEPLLSAAADVLSAGLQPAAVATRSVRSNAVWNLAGSTFYAACQWALISLLAKKGGARQVGEFALGLSISAPVFMLGNLQLRAIQTTDAEGRHAFQTF